jgi:hypothetical protein
MTGLIHAPGPQGSIIELHAGQCEAGSNLHDYLLKSKQELDAISAFVSLGESVARESRDWMLAQADFIVEAVGDEKLELTDETRSELLQMLLAIASLNEQIRSHAASHGL